MDEESWDVYQNKQHKGSNIMQMDCTEGRGEVWAEIIRFKRCNVPSSLEGTHDILWIEMSDDEVNDDDDNSYDKIELEWDPFEFSSSFYYIIIINRLGWVKLALRMTNRIIWWILINWIEIFVYITLCSYNLHFISVWKEKYNISLEDGSSCQLGKSAVISFRYF